MKPVLLISIAVVAVIAVAVLLVVMMKRLPRLTRFLIIVIAPILLAFWYALPALVNIIMDALFILFLYELYKVEVKPYSYEDDEDAGLYERNEGEEYELTDKQGIDWSMTRV